jgi:phosphoribosylpyrophosphate synthetase
MIVSADQASSVGSAGEGASFTDTHQKYLSLEKKSFMTIEESVDLSRQLAVEVERTGRGDLVVGLANGALLPTKVVADELGLPFEIVKVRRKGSRWKQKLVPIKRALRIPSSVILWGPFLPLWNFIQNRSAGLETSEESFAFDVKGKSVVLVDDCIVTGGSLEEVKRRLLDQGAASVVTAVICWTDNGPGGPEGKRPDVFLHRAIHFYPWSNNSPFLDRFEAWVKGNGMVLWE